MMTVTYTIIFYPSQHTCPKGILKTSFLKRERKRKSLTQQIILEKTKNKICRYCFKYKYYNRYITIALFNIDYIL